MVTTCCYGNWGAIHIFCTNVSFSAHMWSICTNASSLHKCETIASKCFLFLHKCVSSAQMCRTAKMRLICTNVKYLHKCLGICTNIQVQKYFYCPRIKNQIKSEQHQYVFFALMCVRHECEPFAPMCLYCTNVFFFCTNVSGCKDTSYLHKCFLYAQICLISTNVNYLHKFLFFALLSLICTNVFVC